MKRITVLLSFIAFSLLVLLRGGNGAKADSAHPHEASTKHCLCGGTSPGVTEKTPHACTASSQNTEWQPASTAADLETAFANTATDQYCYLTNDITLTAPLTPKKKGGKYSICLNGYTLTAPAGDRAFYISGVNSSTYVQISDCSPETTGKILPNAATGTLSKAGGLVYIGSGGRTMCFLLPISRSKTI